MRNVLAVLMRGKGPQEPTFAYDIDRNHSLIIYTDIVEYNIRGDTKTPLLRCFPFISKLKSGDIITTGQYMNYQTLIDLQFRRLLINFFHSIHINLRATSGEKISFVKVWITRLVLMFEKVSDLHFYKNLRVNWLHQTLLNFPTTKVLAAKEGVCLEHLHKFLGERPFFSWEIISSQLRNAWVLICWILQYQQ